jgi:hypothetical protein
MTRSYFIVSASLVTALGLFAPVATWAVEACDEHTDRNGFSWRLVSSEPVSRDRAVQMCHELGGLWTLPSIQILESSDLRMPLDFWLSDVNLTGAPSHWVYARRGGLEGYGHAPQRAGGEERGDRVGVVCVR